VVVVLVYFPTSDCLARWWAVSQSQGSLALEACRIFVREVEAGLLSESVLEIRLLLVPSSELGWSYFDSVVVIVSVLVYETLVVAEVVFSSVGHYRTVVSRGAVWLSFLQKAQA
jgi:hypothetical protein